MGRIKATEVSIQVMGLSNDNEECTYCVKGELITSTVAAEAATAIRAIQGGNKNE